MPKAAALGFASRKEWREWLARNHGSSDGALLFIHKKGSASEGLRYEEALEEALCFGWIDSKGRAHDADRFVLRFSPRRDRSVWSQSNRRRVARLRRMGMMTEAGLERVRAAKRAGTWRKLPDVGEEPAPADDLLEALEADPAALRGWTAFAPSYRRAYTLWVEDAKRPRTRERRISDVVRRSREGRKPGMP